MSFSENLFLIFYCLLALAFGIASLALYATGLNVHTIFPILGVCSLFQGLIGIFALIINSR